MPDGGQQSRDLYPARVPLPDHPFISPWEAAHWRAFGHWRYCGVLTRRSFDQGNVKLPNESERQHAARVAKHRLLDRAEKEVLLLLASGKISGSGRRPASVGDGRVIREPAAQPVAIPAVVFRRAHLSFGAEGELEARCSFIDKLFDVDHRIQGTADDPDIPLYFDVMIPVAELRAVWESADTGALTQLGRPTNQQKTAEAIRPKIRKPPGLDYSKVDEPLIAEMHVLINEGNARNPTDAARALGKRAEGKGTEASKVTRLLTRYMKLSRVQS